MVGHPQHDGGAPLFQFRQAITRHFGGEAIQLVAANVITRAAGFLTVAILG